MITRITNLLALRARRLAWWLTLAGFCSAPALAEPDLIITNAILIDPSGNTEDRRVTLLFEDGELSLVTEDKVSVIGARVYDAKGGLVVGKLALEESPNLLILDGDPREDFAVMRDTRAHTLLAMESGEITYSTLIPTTDIGDGETEPARWLAYTPPPFAVPLSYRDDRAFNRFETPWINGIVTGAVVFDRTQWLTQDDGNFQSFGDLSTFDGGEVRGLRGGIAGTINFDNPWVYVISGATNAFDKGFEIENQQSFSFFDLRVDIPGPAGTTVSVGKQKEPISMERLTGMVFLPFQERTTPADALLPSRNTGIVWSGSNIENRTTWAVGAFNDWLDSDVDFEDNANQFVGRVTWAPSLSGDESNLLHLGIGYRYTDAKEGIRFRSEPEFNKAPAYVDTGRTFETGLYQADSSDLINVEASWRAGPLWLASEYFEVRNDSPELNDPDFDGYYVSASYALTGEMRGYDARRGLFRALPVARTTYQGGWGAVEAAVRFSSVDLEDGSIFGGKTDVASLGLNWWLTPFFQVGINYRYIWNELDGVEGTSSGVNTRLLLILE